jgi:hypothetical protein
MMNSFSINNPYQMKLPNRYIPFKIDDTQLGEVFLQFLHPDRDLNNVLFYYNINNQDEFPVYRKNVDAEPDMISCKIDIFETLKVKNLIPGGTYLFCAANKNKNFDTPFNCLVHQVKRRWEDEPWILQKQKVLIMSMTILIVFIVFLLGSVTAYAILWRRPTLLRGSKRVVLVSKQLKSVMVMPRVKSISQEVSEGDAQTVSPADSRNSSQKSIRKESSPNYLTPVPRLSISRKERRPRIFKSSSEESLSARSYISIRRSPPRFSSIVPSRQEMDFILNKRSESCPSSVPPPLPPFPRHRLSLSTTTPLRRMSLREPFTRTDYQVHESSDETENHYNLVI